VWQLLGGLKKFKMAAVALETKVQKFLNSLQTSQSFALCFLSHPHLVERDKPNKSESVGQTLPQLPWK
jgi:hypothetical protein